MSLAGNLKTISFPDILQLLSAGRKTGVLHVQSSNRIKEVAFRDGNIVYATSVNSGEDLLGALLLRRGRISKEDLERAIALHKQSGRPLGETLVDMRIFSKEDVFECLRMQVEETVYNLFSWPEGEFGFKEGAQPSNTQFQLELPTMSVIMEGTRRIDEWMEIQKVMPAEDILLCLSSLESQEKEEVTLSIDEFRLLPLINGERTVPQIISQSPLGEFPSYRALYRLIVGGFVEGAGRAEKSSLTGIENEEEVVLSVIFALYNTCFLRVRSLLEETLGPDNKAYQRYLRDQEGAGRPAVMSHFPGADTSGDFSSAFNRFYGEVIKLPAAIRMHTLMGSLENALTEQLEFVHQILGAGIYRGAMNRVKKEIADPLAARRELVKRYRIDENFYGALRRADQFVKAVKGE